MGIRAASIPGRVTASDLEALHVSHGHLCLPSGHVPPNPLGVLRATELEAGVQLFLVDVEIPAAAPIESHYSEGIYCSLCLEGRMRCRLNDSSQHMLFEAGHFWLQKVAAGDVWVNDPLVGGRFRSLCLQIDAAWLARQGAALPHAMRPVGASAALRRQALLAFSAPGSSDAGAAVHLLRLRALGLALIAEALSLGTEREAPVPAAVRGRDLPSLTAARELVEREFAQPWTMAQIAARVGLPVRRLKAGFLQAFGCTVFGHLQAIRLARAHDLLRAGRQVTQVALEVGYSHPGSFSRAYRAAYGRAPRDDAA